MATNPKMEPCPRGHSADYLNVYAYESGTRRVECDHRGCWYIGPCEGSVRQAIKSHNAKVAKARGKKPEAPEPCPYCSDGKRTGLPGNACENCMNTGLKYPERSSH